MKKIILILIVITPFILLSQDAICESKVIADFQKDKAGEFPRGWKTWPFQRGKAEGEYQVAEEGQNKFLKATDDKDLSIQIFKEFNWDLEKYPKVSWRWRAKTLPTGANESNPDTNDSACGVYVVFGKSTGVALKYVWSTSLPVRAVVAKKPGIMYIILLDSGSGALNTWQPQTISVNEEFKKYFGGPPSKMPSGIGVLTDGNATHTKAECDYDDFSISD